MDNVCNIFWPQCCVKIEAPLQTLYDPELMYSLMHTEQRLYCTYSTDVHTQTPEKGYTVHIVQLYTNSTCTDAQPFLSSEA